MSWFFPKPLRLWHKVADVSRDTPPVVRFHSIGPICVACGMHQMRLMVGSSVLVVQMSGHELERLITCAKEVLSRPLATNCQRDTCTASPRFSGGNVCPAQRPWSDGPMPSKK